MVSGAPLQDLWISEIRYTRLWLSDISNKVNKETLENLSLMPDYSAEWDQDYSEESFVRSMALLDHLYSYTAEIRI